MPSGLSALSITRWQLPSIVTVPQRGCSMRKLDAAAHLRLAFEMHVGDGDAEQELRTAARAPAARW
jgi:hypothetical protein